MNPEKMANDEFLNKRLNLLQEQDSTLRIGGELGRGDTSTVYDCNQGDDATPKVIKVSRINEGINPSEIIALNKLDGVAGIPKLFKQYQDEETILALLLQRINGKKIRDCFSADKAGSSDIFTKMRKMIEDFHQRGFLMPRDWLKEDNWIIAEDGQPYLLDVGEPLYLDQIYEESEAQIKGNLRQFHSLIQTYANKMGKKDKRNVENLILRDYSN